MKRALTSSVCYGNGWAIISDGHRPRGSTTVAPIGGFVMLQILFFQIRHGLEFVHAIVKYALCASLKGAMITRSILSPSSSEDEEYHLLDTSYADY